MKKLFEILNENLNEAKDVTMVSVTSSSGSTPRGAGARMIVGKEQRLYGTIGGGAVEYFAQQKAQEVLKEKISFNESYILRQNEVQDLGMICGGDVACFFKYLDSKNEELKDLVREVLSIFEENKNLWLVMDITENTDGKMGIYTREKGAQFMNIPRQIIESLDGKPKKCLVDDKTYYIEQINYSEKVYVFGGGHVAQQLVPTLSRIDFNCIVLEDRKEFAQEELFCGLAETRLVDMDNLQEFCKEVTANDYICIMTRGHKDDYKIQRQVLKTPARYIGVIGSKRKTAGVMQKLRNDGYSDEDLKRITAPIGIPLEAETPAEIAISIAGQLINERAKGR